MNLLIEPLVDIEVNFQPIIPDPKYEEESLSPTRSKMAPPKGTTTGKITEPEPSELLAIIIEDEEPFVINKDFLREELSRKENIDKWKWFTSSFTEEERQNFKKTWYNYMERKRINLPLFSYMKIYALKTILTIHG